MSPLAVAQRIPPAATVMVDDDDLALAAAVFQAAAGAFRAVEPPYRRQPLQQRRAAHTGLQPFDFRVLPTHRSVLLSGSAGRGAASYVLFLFYTAVDDSGNREAGAGQGRAQHGSAQRDAPLRRGRRKR